MSSVHLHLRKTPRDSEPIGLTDTDRVLGAYVKNHYIDGYDGDTQVKLCRHQWRIQEHITGVKSKPLAADLTMIRI